MAVLGLILVLASGAFIASAWLSSTDAVSLTALGMNTSMPLGRLIALGALAGLVLALGLAMLFSGMGRASRRRREAKQVVVQTRSEAEDLRLENERLARELQERDSAPAVETETMVAEHAGAAEVVNAGELTADEQGATNRLYVARHRDESSAPVAYPDEPLREDLTTRSDTGTELR